VQKSVPDYALLYRVSDSAQAFGGNSTLRFSVKNPFDFILWDSKRHILYALELKTVAGKSISFERSKDERGEIHFHQINGLLAWSKYSGTRCGFLIEFRELEKTIFLDIVEFSRLISKISKNSFNYSDLEMYDIKYYGIPQKKAITRYTYDIESLLRTSDFAEEDKNGI